MIHIYGIKNCDVMQKALKWLDAKKIAYTFHNYKEDGIDAATLELWLSHMPTDKLINTRSTTYRELGDMARDAITDKAKAIALMMEHSSIIKRPVWDFGNNRYLLGWDEATVLRMIG